MDTLNDILSWLDKIQGFPAIALVLFSCWTVGYLLKKWRWFPNDAIPMVVVMWSTIVMMFIADPRANDMPNRIWIVRNLLIGVVVGLLGWLSHFVTKKVEEWIKGKFGGDDDDIP